MNDTPNKRPSILDVARECGVAPSTVSNALSNKRHVRRETREKIIEVAAQLGYRASTVARGLRMQRSWSIGLLIANISNPYYPRLARGVEDIAAQEKCNLILCNTDYDPAKQERYLNLLIDRRVDGLVLASHPDEEHLELIRRADIPVVLLNKGHGDMNADYVGIDNHGAAGMAVDHLIALGHRNIAFIRGHRHSQAAQERQNGFCEAMERNGLTCDASLTVDGAFDFESGQRAGQRLLAGKAPFTAVVAASDLMAMGAIDVLTRSGRSVPDDVSVIGFDDIYLASMPMLSLTTLHVPMLNIGETAARFLIDRIEGSYRGEPREILFPVELVERSTTATVK